MGDIKDFTHIEEGSGYMVWVNNGFRLARGLRQIRRGRNKGKYEVKYLKGSRIKRAIVRKDVISERIDLHC